MREFVRDREVWVWAFRILILDRKGHLGRRCGRHLAVLLS